MCAIIMRAPPCDKFEEGAANCLLRGVIFYAEVFGEGVANCLLCRVIFCAEKCLGNNLLHIIQGGAGVSALEGLQMYRSLGETQSIVGLSVKWGSTVAK